MKTLLAVYKWQVALAVAVLYIVWPYFNTVIVFVSSSNAAAKSLVEACFITFALTAFVLGIAYTIWNDQRPNTRRGKSAT